MTRLVLLVCLVLPALAWGRELNPFVVGGSNTNIANYPYQLSLRQGSHICGASLISSTRAVTASHCIGSTASAYSVLAGTTDRTVTSCSTCQLRTCNLARRHPNYVNDGNRGWPNDIAVLGFSAIYTNANIQYIQLATSSDGNFAGQGCVITGWGLTRSGGSLPTILQQGSMTVLTNSACASTWGSAAINDGHICIKATSTSSCSGDSGGPLKCNGKLAGATSWGSGNCSPSYPSVYARVSYFYNWIVAQ